MISPPGFFCERFIGDISPALLSPGAL
jgi:hypothetical protein